MSWSADIQEWSEANGRDPQIVEAICVRKGWQPDRYATSMKSALIAWLDQWYTLSVKTLPTPATSLRRRNPINDIFCPKCSRRILHVKRLQSGKMLGSCGDSFHDLKCQCQLCNDIM